jgi:MFS family permease
MSTPLPQGAEPDLPGPSPVAGEGRAARAGFGGVLHNRAFLSLWTAQMLSQTAQNTLWLVLIVMVGSLTGQRPAGIGFTIILVQLPTVLFSGISGVLVDRVSKRTILVGTNIIRVAGVMAYWFSWMRGWVGGLYLVTFLVAVVSQPFAPAEGSTLPLLVSGPQLITANSLFQLTFMISQALGFALAPVALGLLGVRVTLLILAGAFTAAAIVLIPLPAVAQQRVAKEQLGWRQLAQRVWHDLAEAGYFILRDPPLALALFQIALAPTLLLVLAEVGPDFLTHNLHLGQTSTSLFFLLAPAGAGLAAGILILGHWGYRLRKDRLVLVSLVALGVTVIGLAAVPILGSFWQSLRALGLPVPAGVILTLTMVPITFLMGIEVSFINAPVQTIVQERATPELRGRILAMQQTLTAALAIPPLILVGGIAALFGTPATLTLMGLSIIVIGLVIVYYS